MHIQSLKGKNIIILGFGQEGMATFRFLRKYLPDQQIAIADQKERKDMDEERQKLFETDENITLHLGRGYLREIDTFDIIIRSPGISRNLPQVREAEQRGTILTSPTNMFFSHVKGKSSIIGITGSKGKSTTTTLIYEILKQAGKRVELIGNIGIPALESLLSDILPDIFVFELSSYQLEDLVIKPDLALMINFFTDHLDYHGTLDRYFAAKTNIFSITEGKQTIIYNHATKRVHDFLENLMCEKKTFNDGDKSFVRDEALFHNGEKVMDTKDIHLKGKHNQENILAAIAVAKEYDVSNQDIITAVSNFHGLEHRMEEIGTFRGIRFINDANATTPEATVAAIQAFEGEVDTILLGGMDRGYDFTELADTVLDSNIRHIILFPDSGKTIWRHIREAGNKLGRKPEELPSYSSVDSMRHAIEDAYANTPTGGTCLLSAASPSYSIFKGFVDKGEQFREWVGKLGQEN